MKYDLIKDKFAHLIERIPLLRKFFYLLLDCLLLRQWYVKKEIKKYFAGKENIRFYDAGAGFGQYSWFILKNWEKAAVHAVDLKTDYIASFSKYIGKENNFTAQQADLTSYQPRGKFDLIIAIDILEHIEEDEQVLKNFRKVLAANGKLIISSPSNFDEAAKFTEEHVRPGYSKQEILDKLQRNGFEIVDFQYSYGKLGHLAWILIMKKPMQLLEKSRYNFLLLPFYYLFVYPLAFVLMLLDLYGKNSIGTGVLVVGKAKE